MEYLPPRKDEFVIGPSYTNLVLAMSLAIVVTILQHMADGSIALTLAAWVILLGVSLFFRTELRLNPEEFKIIRRFGYLPWGKTITRIPLREILSFQTEQLNGKEEVSVGDYWVRTTFLLPRGTGLVVRTRLGKFEFPEKKFSFRLQKMVFHFKSFDR
jgi:hypothetical protein